jgi:hypothetical protein
MIVIVASVFGLASGHVLAGNNFCTQTAQEAFRACQNEVQDSFFRARGICINESDNAERADCFDNASAARQEGTRLCGKQQTARRDVCASLGENRYEPAFEPALFDNDFTHLTRPNRYFPLRIGNRWQYSGSESVAIEVLNETKLIEGVTCIVVRDLVTVDGVPTEDTNDWFAQAKNGDVYYCGEEVKDFETFEGDNPEIPELVSIDGSFKTGRNGDEPGIAFQGSPMRGQGYRQEFSLGNAEDIAQVLSTTYAFGANTELDQFVPRLLAQRLCSSGNCIVVKEFTPILPGVFERKYYAPGIGLFFSVHADTGEATQLVGCNFDSRCNNLPKP